MSHRRTVALLALALLAAAACDRPPTEPTALRDAPRLGRAVTTTGTITGVDLGVLPGDVRSEAAVVADDGTVYGSSYSATDTRRYFRWTSAGGMQQVSSIPARRGSHPFPTVTPPPGADAEIIWANAKGEATGKLCWPVCGPSSLFNVFRSSPGAGLRNISTIGPREREIFPAGDRSGLRSAGLAINRWGHVAGTRLESTETQTVFFWAPADTFLLLDNLPAGSDSSVLLNDNDQVAGTNQTTGGFVWRPDLGRRHLVPPGATRPPGECHTFVTDQNPRGDVVGWGPSPADCSGGRNHAILWRVPAVNRAAFPKVNASPISFASTISLSRTGGRYYQFSKATQSSARGPYRELIDWGDGTTSSQARSTLGGKTYYQVHTYTRTGTYWVRVYVRDRDGKWGVDERKVTVTN